MMTGHQVLVRAGPLDRTSPFGVSFDGSEFKSIDATIGSVIFAAPGFSLMSDDKSGVWGAAAKLKMKVGVVSVTVEQHTEGRLQDSQWKLDLEKAACNVV